MTSKLQVTTIRDKSASTNYAVTACNGIIHVTHREAAGIGERSGGNSFKDSFAWSHSTLTTKFTKYQSNSVIVVRWQCPVTTQSSYRAGSAMKAVDCHGNEYINFPNTLFMTPPDSNGDDGLRGSWRGTGWFQNLAAGPCEIRYGFISRNNNNETPGRYFGDIHFASRQRASLLTCVVMEVPKERFALAT